ncbi:MAG: BlaI/MecI/CopY family transcriptional regulator [Planctomycetes bacterium]|nr:BlaI/MecI/CopY family transcriptional regulator [Planctomycetota bacterium]
MPDTPRISEAEWDVMRVVWDHEPVTARAIVEALEPHKEWTEATVKTLLNRLVRKGVLDFEVDGKRYLYSARLSREHCVRAESRSFLERVFGGSTTPLLAHFLRESQLDTDQIRELEELLKEKEAE